MEIKEVKKTGKTGKCKCFIVQVDEAEDSSLLEEIYGIDLGETGFIRPLIVCETWETALEVRKEVELEIARKFEAWAMRNKSKVRVRSRDVKKKGPRKGERSEQNVHYTIDADFPWDIPHNFESKEEIKEFIQFLDGVLGGTQLEGEMLIRVVSHFFYTEKRDEMPVRITEGELRKA